MKKELFLVFISLSVLANIEKENLWLDFNTSMAHSRSYQVAFASQNPFWQQVQALYTRNILDNLEVSQETRIPKIIHQIWIGSPLPEKYKSLQETWKRNHPDWQYILWTDKELNALNLINKDKYNAATNMGEKSDIAKYELIYRFGGLYVDTDFECLKPMDILHHVCDFYTSVAYDKECVIYAAIFAGKAGNPILKKCVDYLRYIKPNSTDVHEILQKTGPFFLTRCVYESLAHVNDRTVIFPITYFYPWPGEFRFQNSRPEIEKWFKPESFAVHHWHTSWIK